MGHDAENHMLMGQSPSIKMKSAYFIQWAVIQQSHTLLGYWIDYGTMNLFDINNKPKYVLFK